ncbi:MAG: hypothetical protein WAX69_05420 [Victivallales bacterium]
MKKIIIGIILGFILASLIYIPFVFQQRQSQLENGRHQGMIDGRIDVWKSLDRYFSQKTPSASQTKEYIPIKDVGISVVEKNGVLTIETK